VAAVADDPDFAVDRRLGRDGKYARRVGRPVE
jgi:hypothetical protein